MNTSTISRILVSGTFLVSLTVGINAMAQATAQHSATPSSNQQAAAHKAVQNAAETNPACQQIVEECKKLGFVVGEWKTDNGVWKDCFDPVVHNGKPTREGKPIEVPVSASDVQTCRAAVQHAKQAQKTTQGAEQPKQ
jgi:hypothetical protein